MSIQDRIKDFCRVPAEELLANEGNFRSHPDAQRNALKGILADVGIADALIAYHSQRYGGLTLIDGHLRVQVHGGVWPVLILDVTDEEADLLLASIDPIAAMAGQDAERLDALLRGINSGNEEVQVFLSDLATRAGLYLDPADEPDPLAGLIPDNDRYKEQYGVIVICDGESQQQQVYEELTAAGYNCKVVVT